MERWQRKTNKLKDAFLLQILLIQFSRKKEHGATKTNFEKCHTYGLQQKASQCLYFLTGRITLEICQFLTKAIENIQGNQENLISPWLNIINVTKAFLITVKVFIFVNIRMLSYPTGGQKALTVSLSDHKGASFVAVIFINSSYLQIDLHEIFVLFWKS